MHNYQQRIELFNSNTLCIKIIFMIRRFVRRISSISTSIHLRIINGSAVLMNTANWKTKSDNEWVNEIDIETIISWDNKTNFRFRDGERWKAKHPHRKTDNCLQKFKWENTPNSCFEQTFSKDKTFAGFSRITMGFLHLSCAKKIVLFGGWKSKEGRWKELFHTQNDFVFSTFLLCLEEKFFNSTRESFSSFPPAFIFRRFCILNDTILSSFFIFNSHAIMLQGVKFQKALCSLSRLFPIEYYKIIKIQTSCSAGLFCFFSALFASSWLVMRKTLTIFESFHLTTSGREKNTE